MKIAINAVGASIGGGLTYVSNILSALADIDKKNQYFIFVTAQLKKKLALNNKRFKLFVIPFKSTLRRLLWEQLSLPKLLVKNEIDLLFSPLNIDIMLAPCKSVLVIHYTTVFENLIPELFSIRRFRYEMQKWATIITAKRSSKIIVVSETSKEIIDSVLNFKTPKTVSIYYGRDERFKPLNMKKSQYGDYIFSVSTIAVHKNQVNLVKAFSYLIKDLNYGNDIKLLIAGSAPDKIYLSQVYDSINNSGVKDRIVYLGGVEYERLPELFSGANLFVFPSYTETFGIPLLEAMACGVPIATSKTSVMPEICKDSAIYFDPYNSVDMAKVMKRALEDQNLRTQLINKGLKRADEFSWEKTAMETLKIFEEVGRVT